MIELILTIDYEIYGNGAGSLRTHVCEPMEKFVRLLEKTAATCVVFVEVAELERIEQEKSDPGIDNVREQIQRLHAQGYEIGLHIHPQWYNASYSSGQWLLDYSEYNLCSLGKYRIAEVVDRALSYLRSLLESHDFVPRSFRAGNWLLQPTSDVSAILADRGISVDSSVFKGGLQHGHKMDYRKAIHNGSYWRFSEDVLAVDPEGRLIEFPIYTRMVPFWRMVTAKRLRLQRRESKIRGKRNTLQRSYLDRLRWRYPLKLDFCRMAETEFDEMVDGLRKRDRTNPGAYRPIVAIGHTKDIDDEQVLAAILNYVRQKHIATATLQAAAMRCLGPEGPDA